MVSTPARLRALVKVFDSGSFSEAARQLGVSVPTVTQLIRDFEREAEFRLFEKRAKQLEPTQIARNLYPIAVQFLKIEREAEQTVRQLANSSQGRLRVALGNANPGMEIISLFQRAYFKVDIQVLTGNWSDVIAMVSEDVVDVGVLPDVPKDPRFERTPCLQQRVVAVAAPSNPIATRPWVRCQDLEQERLIFRTKGSSTQRQVDQGFAAAKIETKPAIVSNSRDGVLEAAHRGLGIGFVWEHASSGHEKLVKIVVEEISKPVWEYAFMRKGRKDTLVSAFVSHAANYSRR